MVSFVAAEYDWEDEHTRMAEKLQGSYLDTSLERNKTRDSGFVTLDRGYSSATQDVCIICCMSSVVPAYSYTSGSPCQNIFANCSLNIGSDGLVKKYLRMGSVYTKCFVCPLNAVQLYVTCSSV